MMIAKVVLALMFLTVYLANGRFLDDMDLDRSVRQNTVNCSVRNGPCSNGQSCCQGFLCLRRNVSQPYCVPRPMSG
ncbi:hypothetical protein BsWGS_22062 [Bradybaena similaris]